MLNENEVAEIRRIAHLAAAAREARDRALLNATELDFGEPEPARGEPRPARQVGFEALPPGEPSHNAFREAIEQTPAELRVKLWAVMRTGRGDYARGDWDAAITQAASMPDSTVGGELADEIDLHDHLMKGLYELGVAEEASRSA